MWVIEGVTYTCRKAAESIKGRPSRHRYGAVESVRLRSLPLKEEASGKLPRRAAVATGAVDESRGSANAYVVFETEAAASTALVLNMGEVALSYSFDFTTIGRCNYQWREHLECPPHVSRNRVRDNKQGLKIFTAIHVHVSRSGTRMGCQSKLLILRDWSGCRVPEGFELCFAVRGAPHPC